LTEVQRLDPIRRTMLKDMGIEVWSLRAGHEQAPTAQLPVPQAAAPRLDLAAAAPAAPAAEAPPQREVRAAAATPAEPEQHLAVTCLVTATVVMFVDNNEPGASRRLCSDLLATASGDWSTRPREVNFSWELQGDGWRAFRAFADKQLTETDARLVICGAGLREHLPELSSGSELLELPRFANLDVDAKRTVWRRFQSVPR